MTPPVQGTALRDLKTADDLCAAVLGKGYRMAEHHDGKWIEGMSAHDLYGDSWPSPKELNSGGWAFHAFGNVANDQRFWISINDQPANCWD